MSAHMLLALEFSTAIQAFAQVDRLRIEIVSGDERATPKPRLSISRSELAGHVAVYTKEKVCQTCGNHGRVTRGWTELTWVPPAATPTARPLQATARTPDRARTS